MDDTNLIRYSRHLLLDGFDFGVQERIMSAKALVVGAGGLGSPALLYLAGAGVGQITIYDGDKVDSTNLSRQVAFTQTDVGSSKAVAAAARLKMSNNSIDVSSRARRLEGQELLDEVAKHDIVIDCSDNFATRAALNAASVRFKRKFVSAAAVRYQGYISAFDFSRCQGCLSCMLGDTANIDPTVCATMGVLGPMVGVFGCMQAIEALKLIGEFGTPVKNRLLFLNALTAQWSELTYEQDPDCTICRE